jgi:nucleoside-diphosphate-sugar epimerase
MTETNTRTTILITGANGEIGQSLIHWFNTHAPETTILALDVQPLVETLRPLVAHAIQADITDPASYEATLTESPIDTIFHLAALLSTTAERNPPLAHRVNVDGTFHLLNIAMEIGKRRQQAVKFIFPSSIAVHGITAKRNDELIHEDDYLTPTTMYGINKLYCEGLGGYYADHYGKSWDNPLPGVDFRCVRFPGIISADTTPTGGTSDYAPEMIHAAAQVKPYHCFVNETTTIPFMTMPDALNALIQLSQARLENLSRRVYNVTGFSISAGEIAQIVRESFPECLIDFAPNPARQKIVDSWPALLDDSPARRDWGWHPQHDVHAAFVEYLIPRITEHYRVHAQH